MSRQTDNAAKAVRSLIQKAIDRVQLGDFGIVRAVNPVSVELGYQNEVLDSDELIVTQAVRQYDKDVGLKVGDSLALMPTESGEFIAVGLISDKALTATPATAADIAASSATITAAYTAAIAAALVTAGASAWSPGDFKPTGVAAAPTGWLMCDGSTVSRTTYAALFAAIGTSYNIGGEAGTDFRLPNGIGRSMIGAGTGTALDATAHALGSYGGTETHTLTVAQMPAHSHSGTTGAGATGTANANVSVDNAAAIAATVSTDGGLTVSGTAATTAVAMPPGGTAGTANNPGSSGFNASQYTNTITAGITSYNGTATQHSHSVSGSTSAHSHTATVPIHGHTITQTAHGHTIPSQGGDGAHPNLSPFFTGNWLVKT